MPTGAAFGQGEEGRSGVIPAGFFVDAGVALGNRASRTPVQQDIDIVSRVQRPDDSADPGDVTRLLERWQRGDNDAFDQACEGPPRAGPLQHRCGRRTSLVASGTTWTVPVAFTSTWMVPEEEE